MLSGGLPTKRDEDLMTIRSAHTQHQPRDEARSPYIRERPEKNQSTKHRTKFRVQFLPLAGAALTVI